MAGSRPAYPWTASSWWPGGPAGRGMESTTVVLTELSLAPDVLADAAQANELRERGMIKSHQLPPVERMAAI